jgi:uncharacterized protein YkwD
MFPRVLKLILLGAISLSILTACGGGTEPALPTPNITNISPTEAAVGATITINGTNFGDNINQTTVTIGGQLADKTAISSTGITVLVPDLPAGSQAVTIKIGTPARVSNSASLVVKAASIAGNDSAVPVVTISSPQDGATVSLPFTILGTASHPNGLQKLEYAMDGGVRIPILLQTAAQFGVELSNLVNGQHDVTVFAKSGSGTEAQAKRTFVIGSQVVQPVGAPTIVSASPSGTTVDKLTNKISVTFNKAMDSSVTTGIIAFVNPTTGQPLSGSPAISNPTWSIDKKTFSVTVGQLLAATTYGFQASTLARDSLGNALAAPVKFVFSTKADPVTAINGLGMGEKQDLLNQINAKRASGFTCPAPTGARSSAPAVAWNALLEQMALGHTDVLVKTNADFAKVDPHAGVGDGTVATRAASVGYQYLAVGENIAAGQLSVTEVMTDWLGSSVHCAALMDKDFTQIGAAKLSAPNGVYATYWTLNFGKPQ